MNYFDEFVKNRNNNTIKNYNENYKDNELWYIFMNDGYCDLDNDEFPIDINYKMPDRYLYWKYQANMYKKAIDTGNIKTGSILDVACGRGGGLSFIYDYYNFNKLVGVDINPNHIELAQKDTRDISYYIDSIVDTKFENESFDVINCIEANTYFVPYEKYVKMMYDYLKKDGVYIQVTPIKEKFMNLFDDIGFKKVKEIDITKNVRMSCAISKMRFKSISKKVSKIFSNDEQRYNNDDSDYTLYVFKK